MTTTSNARSMAATTAALVGFAANSLLCRGALGERAIDAWSFTAVRLASGAIVLAAIVRVRARAELGEESRERVAHGSWWSAVALFAYAAAFSFAYLRVGAGIGALVLFASVQATMIGWSIRCGARPSRAEWVGLAIAFAGLVALVRPGAVAPDPLGLALMAVAGAAWGVYSLRGRSSRAPLRTTASNFARSVPLALAGLCAGLAHAHASTRGIVLALASGALASGLGYSLWYLALPALSATRAALLQLLVPVLTAVLAVLVLGEAVSARLLVATPTILGGVAIAVLLRGARAASGTPAAPSAASAGASAERGAALTAGPDERSRAT